MNRHCQRTYIAVGEKKRKVQESYTDIYHEALRRCCWFCRTKWSMISFSPLSLSSKIRRLMEYSIAFRDSHEIPMKLLLSATMECHIWMKPVGTWFAVHEPIQYWKRFCMNCLVEDADKHIILLFQCGESHASFNPEQTRWVIRVANDYDNPLSDWC